MNAIATRWEAEEVRRWAGSAFAALLVHVAAATLLFLRIQWPSPPSPMSGGPLALSVELASLPSSTQHAAASTPSSMLPSRQEHSASKRQPLAAAARLQPLAEVQAISLEAAPPPSNAALPSGVSTIGPTPALSPMTAPQVPALAQPRGQIDVPPSQEQQWLAQVKAQLQRYKRYPRSAVKKLQQDTVTLKFSVNAAGRLTYVRIESPHHYRALDQEVGEMLYLAGPLPMPPAKIPVDKIVWNVPVEFYLTSAAASLARCPAPDNPGIAPTGATATLQQMSAYRARLEQYLAAAGKELGCLANAPEATALASRNILNQHVHSMVDDFNTQARLFQAEVRADALKAQQARQRQLQTLVAQVYADCSPPVIPQAPTSLKASTAESYRRSLVGYQTAVRTYVACIRQSQSAATAPGRGLTGDERAQIDRTAMRLGDAAIQPFNQLAIGFNGQLPRLRQQVLTAQTQQNLAEALVRATAIFPNSSWSVPAPLPTDECFRITQSDQTYQAQLCRSTYVTSLNASTQMARTMGLRGGLLAERGLNETPLPGDAEIAKATQQERIAAIHGVRGAGPTMPVLGIAVAPKGGQNTGTGLQTTLYAVSDLQVAGRHLSLTISRRSLGGSPGDDSSAMHLDLVLSPDHQSLRGYCWTDQQRSECTLSRHQ